MKCCILIMGAVYVLLQANVGLVQAQSTPVIGVYGPFTTYSMAPYVEAVMFDLDLRKNFEPDLVAKYGPPIVSIDNINASLKLIIQTGNSNSMESVGVEQNLDFFLGRRGLLEINGLVGGYHSAIAMPTASVGQVLQKPQVAWGATSPALSNKANYGYFLRTMPPDSIQGQAMWKWINTTGVPKVAIMYQEDSYGEGLKKAINDLAVAAGKAYMVISTGFPSTWDETAAQKAVVSAKATGTKFLLLIATVNIMLSFSRVLEVENCFDGTYQILGSEASVHPPDPSQTTSYPSTAARGGLPIGYQNFQPVSKGSLWPKFLQFWRQMNLTYILAEQTQRRFTVDKWIVPYNASTVDVPTQQWFDGPNAEKNICNECPFLFDAMYTFLFAFNSLYNQGYKPSDMNGKRLLDAVYATSFEGISGKVSFNGVGDRLASYKLEVVVPFDGRKEYKAIGEFSANTGQFTYWKFLSNWTRVPASDPNGMYMKYWMNGVRDDQTPSSFTDCSPGYQQDLRTLICSACDGGRFSLGGDKRCERCKSGMRSESQYASTSCLVCPAGKHAESDGSSECSDCRKGTFADKNETKTCSRCPIGEYQELPGRTFCSACGKHKTTLVEAAEGPSECKCERGYFKNSLRNINCSSQISSGTVVQCEECPVGMICPPGSDLQHFWNSLAACSGACALTQYSSNGPPVHCQPFPLLSKAHYSSSDKPVEIYKCRSESKCPGGPPNTCGDPNLAGLSCFHCTEGWYWTGKECRHCTSYERSGMNLPGLPLLIGPILITLLYRMFGDPVHKWGSWQNGAAALGFLALNHYQITVLASSSNIRTSSSLQQMFDVWKASDDLLSLFKPACSGYQNFSKSMTLRSLTPVALAVEFVFTYSVRWLLSKFRLVSQMELNRLLNVFFSIIFTFFAGIVSMSLTVFKCHTNPGSSPPTLNVDESIVCFESQWYDTVGIGVAAFLFYCVGFGTLFAIIIIKSPAKFQDPQFQMRWKFLLIKYRPDVWWWSMVLIGKGIVNNIGFIFLDTGIAQLYWIMTVVFIYSLLAISWLPWRHRQTTFFDIYMHLSLIMVCSILTWFAQQSLSTEEARSKNDDLSTVIILVNLTPLMLLIPLAGSLVSAQRLRESNPKRLEMNVEKLLRSMKIFISSDLEQVQDFIKSLSAWDDFYLRQAHAILEAEFEGKETQLRCRHYDNLRSSNAPNGGHHSDLGQVDSNPPVMVDILEEKETAITKLTEDKRELEVKVQQLIGGLPDEQHVLPPRTSSRRYNGFTVSHDKRQNSDSKRSGWGRNPVRQPG